MSDSHARAHERETPHASRKTGSHTGRDSKRSKRGASGPERSERVRITISLSARTMSAFDELKRLTDADTDSEVFRNALRLHAALLRARQAGDTILIRRKDESEAAAVELFVQVDDTNPDRPATAGAQPKPATAENG